MFDFNDAQQQMAPQGELIPDGVFSRVKLTDPPRRHQWRGADGCEASQGLRREATC